jgi:hypothetical protein
MHALAVPSKEDNAVISNVDHVKGPTTHLNLKFTNDHKMMMMMSEGQRGEEEEDASSSEKREHIFGTNSLYNAAPRELHGPNNYTHISKLFFSTVFAHNRADFFLANVFSKLREEKIHFFFEKRRKSFFCVQISRRYIFSRHLAPSRGEYVY